MEIVANGAAKVKTGWAAHRMNGQQRGENRRRWGRVALACVALLLATACARPSLELPSFNPPWRGEPADSAPAAAPTTLRVLGWPGAAADDERLRTLLAAWPDDSATLDLADDHGGDYEAALRDVLRGQASADVLFVDAFRLPDLVRDGALLPAENKLVDGDDFYPPLRNAFTVDGTIYCLPREARTLALVHRPDLLAEAQQRQTEGETLDAPSEAWTWDELAAAALAMAGVNNEYYTTFGLAVGADLSRWWPIFWSAGGQFLADDGRSLAVAGEAGDSEAGLAATSYLVDLVRGGAAVRPATQLDAWAGETLAEGRAVMTMEGNWIIPWLQANHPDVPFAITPLPQGDAGRSSTAFTSCYAVSSTTTQLEAAWSLVNYLNQAEHLLAITESGYAMPARKSLRDAWLAQHPVQQPFLDALAYARLWQMPPGFRPVVEAGNDALDQAMDGRIPPADVLGVVESVGNEILGRE